MLLELIFKHHLNNITHRCTHGCTDNIPSSRAPVGAKNIQMSSIIHIIFILSPSLPEVRVRVATETARCGPGRQEKDWPGPEREGGQVGTLLLSHSYLQQRPGGCWWLVGLARQQQGRLPDRAGLQCSGPELGPGCVGSSRFPWHWSLALHSYRSLRLLLRHRIGFTQVRLQGSSSLPCQKNGQQEMKFITK